MRAMQAVVGVLIGLAVAASELRAQDSQPARSQDQAQQYEQERRYRREDQARHRQASDSAAARDRDVQRTRREDEARRRQYERRGNSGSSDRGPESGGGDRARRQADAQIVATLAAQSELAIGLSEIVESNASNSVRTHARSEIEEHSEFLSNLRQIVPFLEPRRPNRAAVPNEPGRAGAPMRGRNPGGDPSIYEQHPQRKPAAGQNGGRQANPPRSRDSSPPASAPHDGSSPPRGPHDPGAADNADNPTSTSTPSARHTIARLAASHPARSVFFTSQQKRTPDNGQFGKRPQRSNSPNDPTGLITPGVDADPPRRRSTRDHLENNPPPDSGQDISNDVDSDSAPLDLTQLMPDWSRRRLEAAQGQLRAIPAQSRDRLYLHLMTSLHGEMIATFQVFRGAASHELQLVIDHGMRLAQEHLDSMQRILETSDDAPRHRSRSESTHAP